MRNDEMNGTALRMVPRVRRIAASYARRLPPTFDLQDLVQTGLIGLMSALKTYDAGRGTSVELFVERRVRGAIQDELRALDPLTRDERKDARAAAEASRDLLAREGRAEPDAVAKRAGLSRARVEHLSHRTATTSNPAELAVAMDRQSIPNAMDLLLRAELGERLTAALEQLPERQRLVVSLYYVEEQSLKQIAEILGVTESRVCQIAGEALRRVKTAMSHS